MEDDMPPDYNPDTYLLKVKLIIDSVDSALENQRTGEYAFLLDNLSKLEAGLPTIVNKTTVRTIASGRVRLQLGLIEELKNSAA